MMNADFPKWRKSSYCGSNACVEVAPIDDRIAMRDSKHVDGPTITFSRESWENFVAGIKHGEFAYWR